MSSERYGDKRVSHIRLTGEPGSNPFVPPDDEFEGRPVPPGYIDAPPAHPPNDQSEPTPGEVRPGGGGGGLLPTYMILLVLLFIAGWLIGYGFMDAGPRQVIIQTPPILSTPPPVPAMAGTTPDTPAAPATDIDLADFARRFASLALPSPGIRSGPDDAESLPLFIHASEMAAGDPAGGTHYALAIDLLESTEVKYEELVASLPPAVADGADPYLFPARTAEGTPRTMVILKDCQGPEEALAEQRRYGRTAAAPSVLLSSPLSFLPMRGWAAYLNDPPAPRPWSIRLGSYRNRGDALAALAKFREKGIDGFYTKIVLDGTDVWWSVYHGHFQTEAAAEAARRRTGVTAAGIVRNLPYTTLVGVGFSETRLECVAAKVEVAADFPPTVVTFSSGLKGLLTGAFVTRKAADEMVARLAEQNIKAWVVRR